jgi:uncharacterized protein
MGLELDDTYDFPDITGASSEYGAPSQFGGHSLRPPSRRANPLLRRNRQDAGYQPLLGHGADKEVCRRVSPNGEPAGLDQLATGSGRVRDAVSIRLAGRLMARFTIYFATDIHGSERCFRKFLNAGKAYGADAVILGGDVTGKALVPIVEQAGGSWAARLFGKLETASDSAELEEIERRIRVLGFYPYRTSPDEHARMAADEEYQGQVFDRVMRSAVEGWVDMAETRLHAAGLPCLVMPGNDDIPAVKDLLSQSSWLIQAEDRVIEFGPYQILSLGYSTVTPWNSPRELSEEQMHARLSELIERIQPGRPVIFNVHNPPADSGTDLAFKLTDDMRIVTAGGEPVRAPVGSHAVRNAIERVQPVLSLHGHIHESRAMSSIGRTKVCNPGSLYTDGILQGVLVTLDRDQLKGFKFVSG